MSVTAAEEPTILDLGVGATPPVIVGGGSVHTNDGAASYVQFSSAEAFTGGGQVWFDFPFFTFPPGGKLLIRMAGDYDSSSYTYGAVDFRLFASSKPTSLMAWPGGTPNFAVFGLAEVQALFTTTPVPYRGLTAAGWVEVDYPAHLNVDPVSLEQYAAEGVTPTFPYLVGSLQVPVGGTLLPSQTYDTAVGYVALVVQAPAVQPLRQRNRNRRTARQHIARQGTARQRQTR